MWARRPLPRAIAKYPAFVSIVGPRTQARTARLRRSDTRLGGSCGRAGRQLGAQSSVRRWKQAHSLYHLQDLSRPQWRGYCCQSETEISHRSSPRRRHSCRRGIRRPAARARRAWVSPFVRRDPLISSSRRMPGPAPSAHPAADSPRSKGFRGDSRSTRTYRSKNSLIVSAFVPLMRYTAPWAGGASRWLGRNRSAVERFRLESGLVGQVHAFTVLT